MKNMEKIIIEHIDAWGNIIDKFEINTTRKDTISNSRVFITNKDGKELGHFIVYDDETIEFINENNS
jgi:hypothetical protein